MLDRIEIQDIVTIAKEAGNAIMEVYKQDFDVQYKQDSSPLTLADKKANDIIEDGLNKLPVNLPIYPKKGVTFLMKIEGIGNIFGWLIR